MKIQDVKQRVILEVYVKPGSRGFRIAAEEDEIVVFCREEPVKGKVNKELIKELSRLFNKEVKLVSRFTSKQKRLLTKDAEKKRSNTSSIWKITFSYCVKCTLLVKLETQYRRYPSERLLQHLPFFSLV